MNLFKYLIINIHTGECITTKNIREISTFIELIYPNKKICPSTVSNRLKGTEKKYFEHYDLLIKELIW